jgi:CheY-specific phosphatase CheX
MTKRGTPVLPNDATTTEDAKRWLMDSLTKRAADFAEIEAYVVTSVGDLFDAYGMSVKHASGGVAELTGPSVMAVIGYASDKVRGALLLLTSPAVVTALRPPEMVALAVTPEDVLRDVLGEFANMLLGRVKNQLIRRALSPFLSTPTTVFGTDLKLPAPTSGISVWHTFSTPSDAIFVRFDATFEPEFVLEPVREATGMLAEGEMVMFETSEV